MQAKLAGVFKTTGKIYVNIVTGYALVNLIAHWRIKLLL